MLEEEEEVEGSIQEEVETCIEEEVEEEELEGCIGYNQSQSNLDYKGRNNALKN